MNDFGLCLQSIIPVRSLESETSEQNTQLLFGEFYEILEIKGKWVYINIENDGQVGFIDAKLLNKITFLQKDEMLKCPKKILTQPINYATKNNQNIILPAGSIFYFNSGNKFVVKNFEYSLLSDCGTDDIGNLCKKFLNSPYLWGGKSALGIDCSGFAQIIYKIMGVQLPRNASQQVELGKTVQFIGEAQKGDLAFFDNSEGNITHVGILLDNRTIIHSSGYVRIDEIDHNGILNKEKKIYSHKLRIIKRIL